MSNDTMIVTMTRGQLKSLMSEVVSEALTAFKEDFVIRTLDKLREVYSISEKSAIQLRKDLIADGIAKSFGPKSWAVMKSECDRYLKSRETEEELA